MTTDQIENDLSLIKNMEFVRYVLIGEDTLDLQLVAEDGSVDAGGEYDDDECELNGSLYTIRFHGMRNLQIEGDEADTYKLAGFEQVGLSLVIRYEGMNFFESNTDLSISFGFSSYEVIAHGHIKGADV